MDAAFRSSKPGKAPCGMDLVPVYADEVGKSLVSAQEQEGSAVRIDASLQRLYGIRLAKAQRGQGKGTIHVFARVAPDETRIYRINFGTEGFVKETHDDAVGNFVTKNQHLAVVYSPDFLTYAGGYLAANERSPGVSTSTKEKPATTNVEGIASLQARADRLRILGMSEAQIDEISRTHKLPEDVYVVSPVDGFILSRNIAPGVRFSKESDLYSIADLSHIWILAEVFGRDAMAFRPGVAVRATQPDTGESFMAKVSNVLPEVDPATRAMKVRLEADNPGFKLRPEMFVSVDLPVSLPAGISVPVGSILDSGLSKRVFVQTSEGVFQSRAVETGWQLGDRIQVVKGLSEGESVVASGTFLVDSESRLQSNSNTAAAAMEATAMSHTMQHAMK
jgi:RND family efflux transporter MFP subunit